MLFQVSFYKARVHFKKEWEFFGPSESKYVYSYEKMHAKDFFGKNFMKATLNELLMSWFDGKTFWWGE